MHIDEEILGELKDAVSRCGGAGEFARKCGIDAANISRYLNGKVRSISDGNWEKLASYLGLGIRDGGGRRTAGSFNEVVTNTAELRECIKDGMMRHGLNSAAELSRRIGYDQPDSITRLLAGKLDWFPEVLSKVLSTLEIDYDSVPLKASERELLLPGEMFAAGARLVRPIPVVSWANAAGHLAMLCSPDVATASCWDVDSTETVLMPVGGRKDTLAFRVSGVSMEPALCDNDVILVEPAHSLADIGDKRIVVVHLSDAGGRPDGVYCKRLFHCGKQVELRSDNPDGSNMLVEPGSIRWIGIAVRKISDL